MFLHKREWFGWHAPNNRSSEVRVTVSHNHEYKNCCTDSKTLHDTIYAAVHKLCYGEGRRGGLAKRYYWVFLLCKSIRIFTKSVKWGVGGGQKLPILA